MLFLQLLAYIQKIVEKFQKPRSYGSELENYITSHNPRDTGDVDRLTREFDTKISNGGFPYAS